MKYLLGLFFALASFELHGQCATPVFTSLSPGSGPIAGGGLFQIIGSGFCSGLALDFGGSPATISSVTPTQIIGIVPSHSVGQISVTISNPGAQALVVSNAFTYINAPYGLVASAGRPVFGVIGQSLSFFGYASGGVPPYTFWWSFQDGGTGPNITGVHIFQNPGTYMVAFFVEDRTGALAFSTTQAYITKPSTNFLTDDNGNPLTDDQGNRLLAR